MKNPRGILLTPAPVLRKNNHLLLSARNFVVCPTSKQKNMIAEILLRRMWRLPNTLKKVFISAWLDV